jgi:hypothetical protein
MLLGELGMERTGIFAHSVPDQSEAQWEPLGDHLKNVGKRAEEFASYFGAAQWDCSTTLESVPPLISATFASPMTD